MSAIPPRPEGSTIQWQPFDIDYERIIREIRDDPITIDVAIVCEIERRWGGGEVYSLDSSLRIRNIGIENIRGDSEFDASVTAEIGTEKTKYYADEKHAWDFIKINAAE